MKLLLVNAIESKTTIEEEYFPPLGLGYIASYLRKNMPSIKIRIIEKNINEELGMFKPDIVGIYSLSQNFGEAKNISKICRNSSLPVIIGGPHITALPSSLTADMDLAVMQEGEETVLELMEMFQGSGINFEQIGKISGIAFYDKSGKLKVTKARELIVPLDRIPFPARDLLGVKKQDRVHLVSSRGCPYHCRYCASSSFWKSVRFFSARYVLEELKMLISKYSPSIICFYDDLFIANKERLSKIVELIKKEGINKQVSFFVTVRANLIDEETVKLLKEMNVTSTNIGLESGNPRILHYLKDGVSMKDNIKAIKIMKKFGLNIGASFIIGSPDETKDEILETLSFIKNNNIASTSNIYILTPLPGTYFWEYALKRGLVSEDMDWKKLNIESKDNLEEKVVLTEKIERKKLFELYYLYRRIRKRSYFIEIMRQRFAKWLYNPVEILLSLFRYFKRITAKSLRRE